jgi:hypothetical protein
MLDLLLIEWVTRMKPGSNSVEGHPKLSHNSHPVDGALVGCWFTVALGEYRQSSDEKVNRRMRRE